MVGNTPTAIVVVLVSLLLLCLAVCAVLGVQIDVEYGLLLPPFIESKYVQ